ncbi:hypothetical protein SOVF_188180, partial [Spinacia oleracea]
PLVPVASLHRCIAGVASLDALQALDYEAERIVQSQRFGKWLLELIGNNAIIVMDDADTKLVRSVVFAAVGVQLVSAVQPVVGCQVMGRSTQASCRRDRARVFRQ